MQAPKRLIGFIVVLQSVLLLAHLFLYETWTYETWTVSSEGDVTHGALWLKLALAFLSVSFIAASLLAYRYTNPILRAFYRAAAVWLGLLSFLFVSAVSSWIIFGVARLAKLDLNYHRTVELLFGAALVTGLYGVFQRWLDANHANHSAPRELAGGVARTNSRAYQRRAPGAREKWQFSAADGSKDFERNTGRNFYCRRFI